MQKMMQCTLVLASDFATFIAFSRTLMTSQGMMRMISSVWNVWLGWSHHFGMSDVTGILYIINIMFNIVSFIIRHKACPWWRTVMLMKYETSVMSFISTLQVFFPVFYNHLEPFHLQLPAFPLAVIYYQFFPAVGADSYLWKFGSSDIFSPILP